MIARLKAFGAFWYDFVIGDDWRIAVAVVVALAVTYGVSTTSVPAWWVLPAFLVVALPLSLVQATRRRRRLPHPARSARIDRSGDGQASAL